MDYTPIQAPASDHHPLNTGLSSELGVTAKGLVDHVNANFRHVFEVLKGEIVHAVEVVDDEARTGLMALAEHVTVLEQQMEHLLAIVTAAPIQGVAAAGETGQLQPEAAPPPPPPNQPGGATSALQAALNKASQ